jgi:phospholipid-binding lipoprotein MlaA
VSLRAAVAAALLFAGMTMPPAAKAARIQPAEGAALGASAEIETSAVPEAVAFSEESAPEGDGDAIENDAPVGAEDVRAPSDPSEVGAAGSAGETSSLDDALASIDESWLDEEMGPDPAERDLTPRWNRRVFAFNEGFMRWVLRPISRGYQAITPKFAREMLARGFDNLESPVILANDVMQADACRAGATLGRFVLNTTIGIAGFFDVATEMGIPRHDTDFGETLGRYGVRSGSFFMLPVLGPSTARDTFGEIVDTALRPEVWLLGGFPRLAVTGTDGLSTYDVNAERLDALRDTSVDFYAALRSAYMMDRDAKIEELRKAGRCRRGKAQAE